MGYETAERRFTASTDLECRTSGGGATIVGYASVYDSPYEVSGFREIVAPSAFRKTVKESDIRALFNHDTNFPLGRMTAGTLEVSASDPHGLHYRVKLPTNPMAQMVAEAIERRDVTGSSFAFEVYKDDWYEADSGLPTRVLREVRLYDVGPVTFPASEATDVNVSRAMRSLATKTGRERDYLQRALAAGHLREAIAGEWDEEAYEAARAREEKTHDATIRVSKLRELLDAIR